ncbi:MAG TPA: helix-turn-helix transcriptional regulator [Vicinamibacterales bacterium]|nr:helix-turn-helix transcriptional regulator [Vicinamibacterales bacterium]
MPDAWRAETFLPLATDALLILLALASRPQHGYGIIRDVEVRSAGGSVLQTGALYRMLRRLLRDLLIEECEPPGGEGGDPRRRYYRLTRRGRLVLDAEVERMAALVRAARLTDAGKKPRLV